MKPHRAPFGQIQAAKKHQGKKEISELQIEEAKRNFISHYEMIHNVNLYGFFPASPFTPEFKKAALSVIAWAKEKRTDLLPALKFITA